MPYPLSLKDFEKFSGPGIKKAIDKAWAESGMDDLPEEKLLEAMETIAKDIPRIIFARFCGIVLPPAEISRKEGPSDG